MKPGDRYHRWTIIGDAPSKNGRRFMLCQCDCGTEKEVMLSNLRAGQTKSCGCLLTETLVARAQNVTGQRFGRLTAVSRDDQGLWACRCDCGGQAKARLNTLRAGEVRSCGCLLADHLKGRRQDITGQRFGRLTAQYRDDDGFWHCLCDCGGSTKARITTLRRGGSRSCGCLMKETSKFTPEELIRGREALEAGRYDGTHVTFLKKDKPNKNSTTGVRGVYLQKNGRYFATLSLRGKTYWLGAYPTIEEAAKARKRGEERYFHPIIDAWEAEQKEPLPKERP